MDSRAKFLGHSVHQQLIVFPLGLLATAVAFDLVNLFTGRATMAMVAYWLIVAGVIGGLLAAPFGSIDWLAIPKGTRAKWIGAAHGVTNLTVVLLFASSWWLRSGSEIEPSALARAAAYAGAGLALLGAWLGGELVGRLGVGVADGAHLNAPSSLSGRPATDTEVVPGPRLG